MNITTAATPIIEDAVQRAALGDEVWWDLAPTMAPTPEGPQALHVLLLYMRSPILGGPGVLTTFMAFENPLELLDADVMGEGVLKLVGALKDARSQMLSQTNGHAI